MKRPLVGVLPLYDSGKESYWMLPGYMKAIEAAGGLPVMLPLTTDREAIRILADSFDGFLFTGGHDLNPRIYGEQPELSGELCEERDSMEEALFHQVVERDKPAFGICRGLQLFNALLGGTLYQDLPAQFHAGGPVPHRQQPPYDRPAHRVEIERGSPLHRIVQKDALMVNSYHHQGVKRLSDRLKAAARAEDGLTEAVYMPGKTFILAVQWHPEFMYRTDAPSMRMFEAFVQHCRN